MKFEFVERDNPTLYEPIIVCGLPGAALVGKFAVDHLISELPAKSLAEIYSNEFPAQIMVKEDGTSATMHNDLYYWKNEAGSDLILFTSDAQPISSEMVYSLSEKVLEFLKSKYDIREVVTLGAYVTGVNSPKPNVYAAVTDTFRARRVQELGCVLMRYGEIKGMNGLLLGMARTKGIPGYILLGETEGHSFDGRASSIVLDCLGRIIGMKFDLEKLELRAKEAQKLLDAMIEAERGRSQETAPSEESANPNYIT